MMHIDQLGRTFSIGVLFASCLMTPLGIAASVVEGPIGLRADTYFSQAEVFGFSGVVAISIDGKMVLHKGYGRARRDEDVAFTADTVFDIGSIAKQFTSAAVLLLESRGKLSTADPITHYLDDVPEDKKQISLHQLLTHTSGVTRDVSRDLDSRQAVTEAILKKKLRHQPGERFAYSNAGYKLLAAIVEITSQEPFDTFVRRELFDAADMKDTDFYEGTAWQDHPVALSYFETADYGNPLQWRHTWGTFGSGHILSTATDMLRWEQQLHDGHILEPATLKKLFTPAVAVDDDTGYAYGWYVEGDEPNRILYHDGDYSGFSTDLRRVEDSKAVLLIATNHGYVDGLGLRQAFQEPLQRMLTQEPDPMPPTVKRADASELAPLEGVYVLESGAQFVVRQQHGVLVVEPRGQEAFSLLHHPEADSLVRYDALNEVALQVMEATTQKLISPNTSQTLELFEFAVVDGWDSLTDLFGPVRGMEILGTAPYPFARTWVRTFAELHCQRSSVLLTYGYRRGEFFDFTTWEYAPSPSAVVAARVSERQFVTWNLWKKRGAQLEFGIGHDGAQQLVITTNSGRWVARTQSHD